MNAHILAMIEEGGRMATQLYIRGGINYDEYMERVDSYNKCLKQECDFIVNQAIGTNECADFEPLFSHRLR